MKSLMTLILFFCLSLAGLGQQEHKSHLDSVIHSSGRNDTSGVLVVDDSGKAKVVQPEIVVSNISDLKKDDNESHGLWGLVKSSVIGWIAFAAILIYLLLKLTVWRKR